MSRRYLVGCAGQFVLNAEAASALHLTTDDEDEAVAACRTGPVGCEVYDSHLNRWVGPTSMAEIDEADARLAARNR